MKLTRTYLTIRFRRFYRFRRTSAYRKRVAQRSCHLYWRRRFSWVKLTLAIRLVKFHKCRFRPLNFRPVRLSVLGSARILFPSIAWDNRPFPGCFAPHYESEAKCKVFVMKISFHSYANKTNFHMRSLALSLAFIVRLTATRNWPIVIRYIAPDHSPNT